MGQIIILFSFFLNLFQWVPEITHFSPDTPFLLVGTKIDLRDDPSTIEKLAKNKLKPITPERAEKLARGLKAVKYVECSALTQVSGCRGGEAIPVKNTEFFALWKHGCET